LSRVNLTGRVNDALFKGLAAGLVKELAGKGIGDLVGPLAALEVPARAGNQQSPV